METLRYIITRACLQEGSLRLLRYLKPHFPDEGGQVNFYDDAGREYAVRVEPAQERLLGLGDFYRQHHLGVNDVVLVTPLLPGAYKVEGVIKPHARPEPARETQERGERRGQPELQPPARQPLFSSRPAQAHADTNRFVTEATTHVREVRTQPAEQRAKPWASMERERVGRISAPTPAEVAAHRAAQSGQLDPQSQSLAMPTSPSSSRAETAHAAHKGVGRTPQDRDVPPEQRGVPVSELRVRRVPAHETEMREARQQVPAALSALATVQPNTERFVVPRRPEGSASAAMQRLRQDLASTSAGVRRSGHQLDTAVAPATVATQETQSFAQPPHAEVEASAGLVDQAEEAGGYKEAGRREPLPLDQMALEELGRRCGYRTDFPASGLVRLRADLANQRYGVLLADSGTAAAHPEWQADASADVPVYRLWLAHEAQGAVSPSDAGVLTREAVRALLAEVREQPFSPLDLRPFWEAGRMNLQSVEALREIRAAQQRDKAKFAQLLRALAQQPAFGVVSPARLAAQLPTLDGDQLDQWLSLLTRAPFLLLARLDDGTYLLEQDVPEFLKELGGDWLRLSGLQQSAGKSVSVSPAS